MAELMPEDYAPPNRTGSGSDATELADALKLARDYPGRWIKVNQPRQMKAPSSWASEIRHGQKSGQKPGERWEANYTVVEGEDGQRRYIKLVRLVPPRDPGAPVPPPPVPPVVLPAPAPYSSQ